MTTRFYLSFWHLCLENLPVGRFERRTLTAAEAGAMIKSTRANQALRCVTQDDWVAPYYERQRHQHESLCTVLRRTYEIAIGIEDFLWDMSEGGSPLHCIAPLQLACLQPGEHLLVVDCNYRFEPGPGNPAVRSGIAEDSVTFDLIESLSSLPQPMDKPCRSG